MSFWWPADYSDQHELRDWATLLKTVQTSPHGAFWPVLGARRSGKTWALKALVAGLGGEKAAFVSLEHHDAAKCKLPESVKQRRFLMFDEPGGLLFETSDAARLGRRINEKGAKKLLEWCESLKQGGKIITMALTPAEWEAVCSLGGNLVNKKDLEYDRLGPLTAKQVQGLASKLDGEHIGLLDRVPALWRRNPFLLAEWLRCAAKDGSSDDLAALEARCIEELNEGKYDYIHEVFYEGLTQAQRDVIRGVAHGQVVDDKQRLMLTRLGLLMKSDSGHHEIGDPVIADHLPRPFRIHHVSDLHFGRKTARVVDAKDESENGRMLSAASGQGPVRDEYIKWLEHLPPDRRPHVVVVSGDIAEWGLIEELEQGRSWLETVAKLLVEHPQMTPGEVRILLVQGNHDVNRDGEGPARHLRFAEVFGPTGWLFPRLEQPADQRAGAHWRSHRLGVGVALLGSPEHGGLAHEYYTRIDPGVVHHRDIQSLSRADWNDLPVRIAVLHHPLAQNPSIATEVAPYSGLTNAGQLQSALETNGFKLLLHGHTHAGYLEKKGKVLVAGAATLGSYENSGERHGFNEVIVVREGDQFTVTVQIYERKAGHFTGGQTEEFSTEHV